MNPVVPENMLDEMDLTVGEKEREQMIALGRKFEIVIDEFGQFKKEGVSTKVILGAVNYVVQLYKSRLAVMGDNYLRLKQIIKDRGLEGEVHEPYNNDNRGPK